MLRLFVMIFSTCALCAACATPLSMTPAGTAPAVRTEMSIASTTLARVNTYTNMSDAQFARVEEATRALKAQKARRALEILYSLERELKSETKTYVVKPGESLWTIAAREDIYANSQLWPLLAQANVAALSKTGYQVRAGQKLIIMLHPTIADNVQALRDADRGEISTTLTR